ncbi:MAG: NAD-dependent deacylase [Lysobacter sp.]|nr:MAG: NAD-dependent deacylase [Lysobacter sp.]
MTLSAKPKKIVVLSGSGISAESGLPTFRDANGLWRNHDWRQLASPDGWRKHPELVLEFYNERRAQAAAAQPNAAHRALAELESKYEVVVVTQNVDDLHERAGSTRIVHLHGQLTWARGTSPRRLRRHIGAAPIRMGDLCEDGSQLRPDIVWFGEAVPAMDEAAEEVADADKVLVVGTSLTVYPAASLTEYARPDAEKALCSPEIEALPRGYEWLRGTAATTIPGLVRRWLERDD